MRCQAIAVVKSHLKIINGAVSLIALDRPELRTANVEFRAMLRSLKFCGALLINLAVAVVATTILDTEVRAVIPTHTVAGIVWKEIVLSVLCSAFLGFFMWRTWRSAAAK